MGSWTPFLFRGGSISRARPGLEGSLQKGEEGERVASSTSGGVSVDDDASEGEDGKRERSGSRFRNSVQSESKVRSVGCNRSICGISNKAEKSSTRQVLLEKGASQASVSEPNVCRNCVNSPGMGEVTHGGGGDGLKKSSSNEDKLRGWVEAGLGSWKDWSKLNRAGSPQSESDTACKRPPSIPFGRLGRGLFESLSDSRLLLGRNSWVSAYGEEASSVREAGDDLDSQVLKACQWCAIMVW